MATGIYKNGVAIIVTYQAVNIATGKTVTMDVYDETHAKDVPKCIAAMTEIGTTGRYYATFTPDAVGEWILIMKNTTDSNGEVVKAYAVAGSNLDSITADISTLDGVIDAGFTAGAKEASLAALATSAEIATLDGVIDAGFTTGATAAALTTVDTVVDGIQTDLSNGTDGLGAIKTAVDAIGSPAMVG
jgi:hypothetical protein